MLLNNYMYHLVRKLLLTLKTTVPMVLSQVSKGLTSPRQSRLIIRDYLPASLAQLSLIMS